MPNVSHYVALAGLANVLARSVPGLHDAAGTRADSLRWHAAKW